MSAPGGGRLKEVLLAFGRLGLASFGGPLATIGMMHRDFVERRAWLTSEDFAGAFGFMQVIPGPTATEMAIYLGAGRAGTWGGLLAGLSYIFPGFLAVLALSWVYFRYGGLPAVSSFFRAVEPAAAAVLVAAAHKMASGSVRRWLHYGVFCASFALCWALRLPIVLVLLIGGFATLAAGARPGLAAVVPAYLWTASAPPGAPSLPWERWLRLFAGCLKAGALVVGGGYVIVPFLAQDFVDRLHYLSPQELLAGFAIAKATPGPISLTATFVGFKAAGLSGALLATVGIFLPCFVFLLLFLPWLDGLRKIPSVTAFMKGVEVAAVGTILFAAADLVQGSMDSWTRLGLFAACLVLAPVADPALLFLLSGAAGVGMDRLLSRL